MNQILCCDWLPERVRWSHLARSGLPVLSHKKNFPKSHIINPLLTKLVRSRWLDFFCVFMDLDSVSVHNHAKKELGQYPAILTSHLVNNPYVSVYLGDLASNDSQCCNVGSLCSSTDWRDCPMFLHYTFDSHYSLSYGWSTHEYWKIKCQVMNKHLIYVLSGIQILLAASC